MISIMRDDSVARTTWGTLAGISTTVCAVVCTSRPPIVSASAARLDDLAIPAGNRLERLKGQQAKRDSIRVNDQYRLTFRWKNGHAYEVCVEDYH